MTEVNSMPMKMRVPSTVETPFLLLRYVIRVVRYSEEPHVYGVYTDEGLREELERHGVGLIEGEGAVNGLNGVLIGVAKSRGIEGVCLMGEIKYANVPQHMSLKAVLEKLASILGLEIDTTQLAKRAKRIDASIRKSLVNIRKTWNRPRRRRRRSGISAYYYHI